MLVSFPLVLKVKGPTSVKVKGPTSVEVAELKTDRGEMSGSNPGRACRPSHSEFSVVFSETRVNTG